MNTQNQISIALVRIEEAHFLGSDSDKISEARARLREALKELTQPVEPEAVPVKKKKGGQ